MTIAIGTRCQTGVLLYADKKVIASDGVTTEGCKIYRTRLASDGFLALASASTDAIAAEALAVDIMGHARMVKEQSTIWGAVQTAMVNWCKPYGRDLPSIQFLMALRTEEIARLYLLQPRNQIVPILAKRAIGAGGRVVDVMLDDVIPDDLCAAFVAKVALFNLAYMVRRAKDQESRVGGGSKSNAIFLPHRGRVRWIDEIELMLAEDLAATVDEQLNEIRRLMMGLGTLGPLDKQAEIFKNWIITASNSFTGKIEFSSLVDDDVGESESQGAESLNGGSDEPTGES